MPKLQEVIDVMLAKWNIGKRWLAPVVPVSLTLPGNSTA
jgi:hypothetical protein